MKFDIRGCYDLHIHTSPDVIARKVTDHELAVLASGAGMGGVMIKSHVFPTAGRAAALKNEFPDLKIFSGIALNRTVGGINPDAVEAAAKMGIQYVWLPTLDARRYMEENHKPCLEKGITVFDEDGKLRKEVGDVIDLVKKYDLTFGSGHIGTEDSLRLAEICRDAGVRKYVLTHVSLPVCQADVSDLREARAKGAYIEYSYTHVLSGKCSIPYIAGQIKELGCDRIYLSTDLGQAGNVDPVRGYSEFCGKLAEAGIPEEDIYRMTKQIPKELTD
ncbi:MAG: amidohydrolase [Stomatobaculum sp.]|nr:amidohydrolase [Stomatobaculum sp.]